MAQRVQKKKRHHPASAAPEIPQVALLLETSREFGRGVIRGVSNYAKAHGPWNFYINPADIQPHLPPSRLWHIDAVLGRISQPRDLSQVLSQKIPVVWLGYSDYPGPCYVRSNSPSVCRLVFEHLQHRGFVRFAYCGEHTKWGDERREDFLRCVQAARLEFHDFKATREHGKTLEQQLIDWLTALPKPIGLLAQDDLLARVVIDMCRFAGVSVPEQIAVIGVDNDELICNVSTPTLSSVSVNAELVGFRAASALDALMRGEDPGPTVLVEPLGVISRQSTDTVGVDDPVVAEALRFIREHFAEKIAVSDLVRRVLVSRRTLELRFEKVVGRSPYEEIERVRLLRARELLVHTDMKIASISAKAGFASAQYMHQVFQRELAQTPGHFRVTNRPLVR